MLVRCDVRDAQACARRSSSAARPEAIFHLAAQVDVRVSLDDPGHDARTNVEGTINVLEAARTGRRGAASSSPRRAGRSTATPTRLPTPETVAPLPMAAYGQSKFCAERYLGLYERLYGLSTIALRFGNVYGPRQDPHGEAGVIAIFCGRLCAGETADDLRRRLADARLHLRRGSRQGAASAPATPTVGGVVNIGTETETSVLELLEVLSAHHGPDAPEAEFEPRRTGEIERSCLDATRARELLGWKASTPIAEGLRLTYDAVEPDA